MRILAIDTATNACSASLLTDDGVFECYEVAPRGHTRLLLPMIEDVLKQGQTLRNELTAIAYIAGPGSFTGIRIATSMAQGLSLGLDIPVIPLSSLLVLAYGARRKFTQSEVFPYIDARREQVYWAHYSFENGTHNDLSSVSEPRVIVPDCLTKLEEMVGALTPGAVTYGSGDAEYLTENGLGETGQYPRASDALAIAANRLRAGKASAPGDAQAIYFRRGL